MQLSLSSILPREETMKMRLLLTLAVFAIGFVVPALAQEQKTVDPEVRQQIEAILMKYDEAYNKHDAAAVAAFYTDDADEVNRWLSGGTASGQPAIEKRYVAEATGATNMAHKLVQAYAIGNDVCAFTEYSVMMFKGQYVVIFVRDADTWRIRMAYAN